MRQNLSVILTAIAVAFSASATLAADTPTALIYRDKPVNGYLGGHADFPKEFVGQYLCENGSPAPDARSSCIKLDADGNGTWENDVAPGARKPAARIKWYVVADQQGTVTKVSSAEADTYFVILEFAEQYYASAPGDKIAFPARIIRGAPSRVVIDSKYRNLN